MSHVTVLGNLHIPADVWLAELFQFEFCEECGHDAEDHIAVPFLGNWFAICKNDLAELEGIEAS